MEFYKLSLKKVPGTLETKFKREKTNLWLTYSKGLLITIALTRVNWLGDILVFLVLLQT